MPLIHLRVPSTADSCGLAAFGWQRVQPLASPFCLWETEISSKFKQWDSSSGCGSSVSASPKAEDGCTTVRCGSRWPVSAPSAAWEGKTAAEQLLPLASPHSVVFSHPIIFFFFFLSLHQVFARQMGLSSAPAQPDSPTERDAEGSCAATHLLLLPSKQGRGTGWGARRPWPRSQDGRRVL